MKTRYAQSDDIPPPMQRDYDRIEPGDDQDDPDEEELERRAIVRAVKAGKPIPDDFQ